MSGATLSGSSGGTTAVSTGAVELTESAGRALKLQTDAPHLVSMGGDRLSTAVTLHPIPQGRLTLGSGAGVDIPVHGTGVLPLHCHIDNYDGVVTLYPVSGNLSVDGVPVCGPTRLSQGVMLTIGRSNYMRFNHPAEAKLMKSVLPNSRISMAPITFENDGYQSSKFNKKPPVAPRKSPRGSLSDEEPPSNIMTKVSKFEYLAAQNFKKSISPKVFSSNLVTVNTPAKDVLGKAPPDLHNFAKNISQPAVNYSESNYMDKQKNKTPDRQIFGCKSASYVNVSLQETKSINNKVVIFENGCIPKPQNVTYEQPHELNNITRNYSQNISKNVNISKGTSAPFLKNPPPLNRSMTPNPVPNNSNYEHRLSGSVGDLTKGSNVEVIDDLAWRKNEAELRRNQAQVDRIKEQEIEKAEQARLEEILNMFAEYDKQIQSEKANKPTPNRIKTNGSLPRDKRACISPNLLHSPNHSASPLQGSPSQSKENQIFRFEKEHLLNFPKPNNSSYENVSFNQNHQANYEHVEIRKPSSSIDLKSHMSTYENVTVGSNGTPHFQQSPRTKIKTFIPLSKDSSRETIDASEAKYSPAEKTDELFSNQRNQEICASPKYKSQTLPPKFILPMPYVKHLENYENLTLNNHSSSLSNNLNLSHNRENEHPRVKEDAVSELKVEKLKGEKVGMISQIAKLKRQMAEMENHSEELNRELELEKALIIGEYKSKQLELEKLENRKEKLIQRAQKIDEKMNESQVIQEEDQNECKDKLQKAQDNLTRVEIQLSELPKGTPEHNATFEELLIAQEELDNERKTFEDLEFHHLEEEADWLASREEIQREIVDLSKRIEDLSLQINDLDKEKSVAANSNANEYTKIEEKRLEFSQQIEELRHQLKLIDTELINLNNRETDDDVSTDSDSDKQKNVVGSVSGDFSKISDLSCSYIISSTKIMEEDFNMSRSFNEKMLQEKSILDDGLGKKFPSQDDIDRISKVTTDAPINMDDSRGSLGSKTIESLKEIERIRQIHLVQQGSQVIENERRRVLALKQKVQNEVRSKWAQRKQDCESYNSTGSDETQNGITDHAESPKEEESSNNLGVPNQPRTESEDDSPRPLSETSDISVDVSGGTLSRRRGRTSGDKHRPLTRYLPIRSSELDLRQHIESAGHQADLCPHVKITTTSCRGFLHKKGSKLNGWSRRWFVFDRVKRHLAYYADKSEKKIRGGALFEAIEEVYLDHANSVKSPNPQLTFVVKTNQRYYYLMAPSPEAMRIWIDVIFTGAEGYQEFELGT